MASTPAVSMLLIAVAWVYVVLMAAVVEATSTQGTLLGAFVTFVLYGMLPISIVTYLMLSPARKRARRAAEAEAEAAESPGVQEPPDAGSAVALDPDGRGHPAGDPVAPVGKEP